MVLQPVRFSRHMDGFRIFVFNVSLWKVLFFVYHPTYLEYPIVIHRSGTHDVERRGEGGRVPFLTKNRIMLANIRSIEHKKTQEIDVLAIVFIF